MNTPICDAAKESMYGPSSEGPYEMVHTDLARQLERDRARLLELVRACASLLPDQNPICQEAFSVLASLEIKDKP